MRLSKITIQNFKGLRNITICIPKTDPNRRGSGEFVSIVGPNNVGKSSVMDAIALACPGETSQATIDLFPFRDEGRGPIVVEFDFDDITEVEQAQLGIDRYVTNGRMRGRKTWREHSAGKKPDSELLASPGMGIDWDAWTKTKRSKQDETRPIIDVYERKHGPLPSRRTNAMNATLEAIANEIGSPLLVRRDGGWEKTASGAQLDAFLPKVIRIPAVRDARDETESGKKQSTIRKLVTEMFRERLESDPALAQFRKASRDVERMFTTNSKNPIVIELEDKITRHLQDIISIRASLGFTSLDLNTVSADLASRTELWIREIWTGDTSAPETRPEHQGHGAQRALIVSLLQLFAEQLREAAQPATRLLFLVDEPEIYLHPEMCRRMRDALLRLAREGRAQVICTTHSPIFLDLADRHDGILILKKSPTGDVTFTQRDDDIFGGASANEQRERLRMVLTFDPVANEIFFAERVCLVEGETEIAALDAIAHKLVSMGQIEYSKYAAARRRLAMVNCRGKWTLPPFQTVLNAFGIHHIVVHDKDADDEDNADAATARIFVNVQEDEDRRLVHDPNFDKVLLNRNLRKNKPWQVTDFISKANPLPPAAIRFFEFALGCTIADLGRKEDTAEPLLLAHRRSFSRHPPQKKSFRDQLRSVDLEYVVGVEECQLSDALGLPGGGSVDTLERDALQLKHADGRRRLLARVLGDAMENTLVDGDWIELLVLRDTFLEKVGGERKMLQLDLFRERVHHDAIHILSMDEDIERGDYVLRRVILDSLSDGGWFCRIRTDNPDVPNWGHLGQVIVHRTQRVKFVARVLGIVQDRSKLSSLLPVTG